MTSKEIERKRLLISKFKEDNIDRTEIQELIAILEREKQIVEEEDGEGEDGEVGMMVFAISSLISHLSGYLKSQSKIKEE
jgi:hypothetical protein